MILTLKDRVKNYLAEHIEVLTAIGQGSLDPLVKEFPDTGRKLLSKYKNEAIKDYENGSLQKVDGIVIKQTTEKTTAPATKKTTLDATFTKDEVEKLKELIKVSPGKRSNYEIIYKIRSWNDTEPRSIRISKRLFDMAKKKATEKKLTLQEFINLAIYEALKL